MIEIELTPNQLQEAGEWADERHRITKARGKRNRYGMRSTNEIQLDRVGMYGEYVVAQALDLMDYWTPVVAKYETLPADIGEFIQVRTRSRHWYELILHPESDKDSLGRPKDPDDHLYILVTFEEPIACIRGWIHGDEGKQRRWWKDPAGGRPAFFVPQDELYPVEQLIEWLDTE